MRSLPRIAQLAAATLAGALLAGGGYALASGNNKTIRACADGQGVLHYAGNKRCRPGQRAITWSRQGPPGPQGPPGQQGAPGSRGAQGLQGPPAASAWAMITETPGVGAQVRGQNIIATYLGNAAYSISVTGPTQECANLEAPINVTPEDNAGPYPAGHVPVVSVSRASGPRPYANTWTVQLYDESGSTLTPMTELLTSLVDLDVTVTCPAAG